MLNQRMQEKLEKREAIDVRAIGEELRPGFFRLNSYIDDVDYCDAANEAWIWSIGQNLSNGEIHASTSAGLYQNPDYRCLWVR